MEELRKTLEEKILRLEVIEQAAENDLRAAPEGTLRISKNKNTEQYYWRTDGKDPRGKYIRRSEIELAKKLAQKDYAQKVVMLLKPLVKKGGDALRWLEENDPLRQVTELYEKCSPARKKLIAPYRDSEEIYAEKWEQKKKVLKDKIGQTGKFPEASTEIYTEKGECVRSKSEKILADKLYMKHIPYAYEVPLYISGYGYIKPDFTVLNRKTRKEYYWEHLGMMDDKNYCEKAIRKIETLERNGILPGKNLILTYETSEHPLNSRVAERLAEEYLL